MSKNSLIAFLMLLTLAIPFAASGERFYLQPSDLELGKTETLQFILENTTEYYGFQADVKLPAGLEAMKNSDGELDITLSSRADEGEFFVNSNEFGDGSMIMGAVSMAHKPFTGTDGVLVSLKVAVSDSFAGGDVEVSNVMFINSQDKDVDFESTSASFGVAVTGITLSETALNLTEGDTAALTATIAPATATDKTVTWTSSDEAVASVDDNGNVTAVTPGSATITATTANGLTATCEVTVAAKIYEVIGITLDKTELSLVEDETATLTVTIDPENATDKTVTWASSDNAVATVDAEGKVTAVKAGIATITATTANGKTATCAVTVAAKVIAVTGISLDKTELSMTEGDTATLTATVAPADATDKTVTWTSSDAAVAVVDANGKVTAVKAGNATITATTANGKTATCTVTVAAKIIEVTGVTLNSTELSLTEGDTAVLTATVAPADSTDKTVTWTSSDNAVATVDAEGKVTAVKAGTATITVTTANGNTATCAVTVEAKVIMVESLTIDPTEWTGVEGSEFKITATVLPEDATDKTLSFESSDTTIATVDEEGNVKVLKNGSCVITVSTTDGSDLTAECAILGLSGVEAIFGSDDAVDVYDMNGAIVKKNSNRTDLKQLPPGVYILRSGSTAVKAVIR